MKILLLTHEREFRRKTSTGVLAAEHSNGLVEQILWERKKPNKNLLEVMEENRAVLIYPTDDEEIADIEHYDNMIVIDGTWQEAQKIFNRSQYLKGAPKYTLKSSKKSKYTMRRNQRSGGLCTIECVVGLLKLKGLGNLAEKLDLEFERFNDKQANDKQANVKQNNK